MSQNTKQIFIGMSGGVDSSVAAFLLKEAGYAIQGVFMKNWDEEDQGDYCPQSRDMADAQAVCDKLQIELTRINFAEEYWQAVFSHFLSEYQSGRTPNPDILCNKEIKFKAFLDWAKLRGADKIATGHYGRIVATAASWQLMKAKDQTKDQSYFLYALNQYQLSHSLFPLGDLTKLEVRAIAKKIGLANHNKKDSTGICFIGERKFKDFLANYVAAKPGPMVTAEGITLGEHEGLMFYTLGQRQGLKIGGRKDSLDEPWYVLAKDTSSNTLIIGQGQNHPLLYSQSLHANQWHWIQAEPPMPYKAYAKTRYRQADQACIIHAIGNKQYRIDFTEPQRAVTPGQSVVIYDHDICLGGGIIIKEPML